LSLPFLALTNNTLHANRLRFEPSKDTIAWPKLFDDHLGTFREPDALSSSLPILQEDETPVSIVAAPSVIFKPHAANFPYDLI
jgi:hypothetical protein